VHLRYLGKKNDKSRRQDIPPSACAPSNLPEVVSAVTVSESTCTTKMNRTTMGLISIMK
jgi:hypothetical protein